MKRKRLLIIPILILAAVVIALVSACTVQQTGKVPGGSETGKVPVSSETGKVSVSAVTVENTDVYLNTVTGNAYNTHQLYPIIFPDNASNKKVIFYFADSYDTRYVDLSPSGLITAKAEKRDENEKVQKIEIIIASAENSKVKTSVFVTVENVAAKEVYFSPAEVTVNLASKPFKAEPRFIPAHASVDTDITFSSNDESIAKVDADGTVRPVGHGTTTIVATAYGTGTLPGYLRVKVQYAPPQYSLKINPDDAHAFKQNPGDRRKISFMLMPYGNSVKNESGMTLSDSNPSIVWSVGGKAVSPVPDTKAERYDFIPEANVTPGVYYVTVTIKDADDQMIMLTSDPIAIFYPLSGITVSCGTSEFDSITVGDSTVITAQHSQNEHSPDSYRWYYYKLTENDREAVASGSYSGVYDYVSKKKVKPTLTSAGDYTLISGAAGAAVDFRPTVDGDYFFIAVPVEGTVPRYDLMASMPRGITVEPASGSLVTGLRLTYQYTERSFLPKLTWQEGIGDAEYSVEVLYTGGERKTFSTEYNSEMFDGASFVFPETGVNFSREFRIRVRANGAYGWSDGIIFSPNAFNSALRMDADVKKFYSDIEGLPFDLVMDDPYETGKIINYIRVMQPTENLKTEAGSAAISLVGERRWRVTALYAYSTAFYESMGVNEKGEKLETRKVVYPDGSEDTTSYASIVLDTEVASDGNSKNDPKWLEYLQTVKLSFYAYVDTVASKFGILSNYQTYSGGMYSFTFEFYIPDADGEINSERLPAADRLGQVIDKFDGKGEVYTAVKGTLPENYEFFAGRNKQVAVTTSDQLYYTAVLGLAPVPVAGSPADKVYKAAKDVLRSIVSADATDREIVIAVYDYIVQNVNYDRAAASSEKLTYFDGALHLEGVFGIGTPSNKHIAVCDGYAKAFALMLNMMNIPCLKIIGSSNEVGHAWNKFFIDGKWYLADTTWGASSAVKVDGVGSGEFAIHTFLFATDAEFAGNHTTKGLYPETDKVNERLYYRTAGTLIDSDEGLETFIATVRRAAAGLGSGGKIVLNCWFDTEYLGSKQKSVTSLVEEIEKTTGITLSLDYWQQTGGERRVTVSK